MEKLDSEAASLFGDRKGRRAFHEGPVRKHHQTDTIIIRYRNFSKTCRRIGVVPQPVERAGPYPTEAASIDRDENIEMPILTELPCHELTCARGRLPVNPRQRITISVATQLMQFRAGAHGSA